MVAHYYELNLVILNFLLIPFFTLTSLLPFLFGIPHLYYVRRITQLWMQNHIGKHRHLVYWPLERPGFNDIMSRTSYTTVSKYSENFLFPCFFQIHPNFFPSTSTVLVLNYLTSRSSFLFNTDKISPCSINSSTSTLLNSVRIHFAPGRNGWSFAIEYL